LVYSRGQRIFFFFLVTSMSTWKFQRVLNDLAGGIPCPHTPLLK